MKYLLKDVCNWLFTAACYVIIIWAILAFAVACTAPSPLR